MKDLIKEELKKRIDELSKQVILMIQEEENESLVILGSLTCLLRSFAETIRMKPEEFKNLMQSMVNDFREL